MEVEPDGAAPGCPLPSQVFLDTLFAHPVLERYIQHQIIVNKAITRMAPPLSLCQTFPPPLGQSMIFPGYFPT